MPSHAAQNYILENYTTRSLPAHIKTGGRVKDAKFFIPQLAEYPLLLEYDYKVDQLKKIAKHYRLSTAGNKSRLVTIIYNYMKFSTSAVMIQKHWRRCLVRLQNAARGPALFKRDLCTNSTDFLSFEPVKTIPVGQFISYKDDQGYIYGFDVVSLYQLYVKNKSKTVNPYNRAVIPPTVLASIRRIARLGKARGAKVDLQLEEEVAEDTSAATREQQLDLRTVAVFQNIDALGHYTNIGWFKNLTRQAHIKFLRELNDIWHYRAQLSREIKRAICPPNGDPFFGVDFQMFGTSFGVARAAVGVIEKMVNSAHDNEHKTLGAYYVLGALTLVSPDAADALPWLYQSVFHN
jgi:hypothetical protein